MNIVIVLLLLAVLALVVTLFFRKPPEPVPFPVEVLTAKDAQIAAKDAQITQLLEDMRDLDAGEKAVPDSDLEAAARKFFILHGGHSWRIGGRQEAHGGAGVVYECECGSRVISEEGTLVTEG